MQDFTILVLVLLGPASGWTDLPTENSWLPRTAGPDQYSHDLTTRKLMQEGDFMAARDRVRQVLSQNPDHIPSLESLAQIELLTGRYVLAEDYWYQLINLDEENLYYLASLAGTKMRLEDYDTAHKLLHKVLERDPEHQLGRFLLLICQVALKEYATIERLARLHTSLDLGQFAAWLVQDQALADQSPRIYRETALLILTGRRDIGFRGARIQLAKLYESSGSLYPPPTLQVDVDRGPPASVPVISRLLTQSAQACAGARDAVAKGDYATAIKALEFAQRYLAWQPCIYQDIALYHFLGGDQEKGLQGISQVRHVFPGHGYVRFTEGMMYLMQEKPNQALARFNASLIRRDLSVEEALGHAMAYAMTGDCDRARDLLNTTAEEKSLDKEVVFTKIPKFLKETYESSGLADCMAKIVEKSD